MTLNTIFMLGLAAVAFIVVPIAMVWGMVDFVRGKKRGGDERRGGGSISSAVGGAMLELDRVVRPSVEHTIEAEHQTPKREDDSGGE